MSYSAKKIRYLVIDVDGILTNGCFSYDSSGKKVYKIFGPDDNDALSLVRDIVEVVFVSADKRGFSISHARVEQMGFSLFNVSSEERLDWIKKRYPLSETCYIGDGFYDAGILKACGYSITTKDSALAAMMVSSYVTKSKGGSRGLSEAILHLTSIFYPEQFERYCHRCRLDEDQANRLRTFLSGDDPVRLCHAYVEHLNAKDVNSVVELLDSDCVIREPKRVIVGLEELRAFYVGLLSDKSFKVEILRSAHQANIVMLELSVHTSGKDFHVVDIVQVSEKGKIKEIKALIN